MTRRYLLSPLVLDTSTSHPRTNLHARTTSTPPHHTHNNTTHITQRANNKSKHTQTNGQIYRSSVISATSLTLHTESPRDYVNVHNAQCTAMRACVRAFLVSLSRHSGGLLLAFVFWLLSSGLWLSTLQSHSCADVSISHNRMFCALSCARRRFGVQYSL